MSTGFSLNDFVRESNRIEGIHRDPTREELNATIKFLDLKNLSISAVVDFVAACQPGAVPRFAQGLDVRVGKHLPPRGGPHIQPALQAILDKANTKREVAYEAHIEYEMLHPFTDGNGRSGRAIWLWSMGGIWNAPLGFLHHFYYQTLQSSGRTSTTGSRG